MAEPKKHKLKDPTIYLTLFKLEGHKTWRPNVSLYADGFDAIVKADPNYPKVTERKVYKFDKLTGVPIV